MRARDNWLPCWQLLCAPACGRLGGNPRNGPAFADPARVLQALLGAAHGAGPPQLPRAGGDDGGGCQQGEWGMQDMQGTAPLALVSASEPGGHAQACAASPPARSRPSRTPCMPTWRASGALLYVPTACPLPARLPAPQVGCSEIVGRIVEDLKDESEPYRCAGQLGCKLVWYGDCSWAGRGVE